MDTNFSQLLDSATSVLVLLPSKPTFDQVAAGLSLYLSLNETSVSTGTKKEVAIMCPSPMMVGFNRLIGINKVVSEVGNKNLTIKFVGYDAGKIEKVSYDIEQGEFRLTVVPKPGEVSPEKDMLNLSYNGMSCDLVILVGGANDSHFPLLESQDLAGAKVLHIGTRVLTSAHEVMSFAKTGATSSELVATLIKENNLSLDNDIATNLVMGIEEGSTGFTSSDVIPETFETFAFLLRSGGQRILKNKLSPAHFPPGAIPSAPFSQRQPKMEQPIVIRQDIEGTQEEEQDINPPEDWLQPKVFKGATVSRPDSFSENKG